MSSVGAEVSHVRLGVHDGVLRGVGVPDVAQAWLLGAIVLRIVVRKALSISVDYLQLAWRDRGAMVSPI